MQRRPMLASTLALLSAAALPLRAQPRPALRLLTHDSFELPPELLKRFEAEAGVQLQIVKGGDAGEMLNRLILTRRKPLADLVFGIDNALLPRALDAGVLDAYDGPAARRASAVPLEGGVVPVDFGFVALNIDRAWFASRNRALPTSLQELAQPAWRNLMVVQSPATSSPGQAFLQATIAGLGEEAAFDWWARMRANGVKVVRGWTEAYYTEFTRNGGTRPIVVSYAGSPAAEVFFADKPLETSPTASLFLPGGVFRQVEGVALVKGGNPAVREAAGRFIEFLRSAPVQQALQTTMWMYPAEADAPLVEVMRRHAPRPDRFDNPPPAQALARARAWQERWTRVVLK
ncbi:thiamine ABC transporter substrate binding subunit [uncultured Hydrogenophaga sp.]|uniref:thiamine ABC transporter substrate-binding protein n=1 Tax=uncultured Hydrogenophaga sp. TaxID=199683 RepID=UPI00265E44C3|nr:thiamine ABC transporter substrate-binding protein [uncultured Hydrogenophaga sp.]